MIQFIKGSWHYGELDGVKRLEPNVEFIQVGEGFYKIVDDKLPDEWTVVTRDLFADFGEFTLNGLAFSPIDGAHAYFDHIYLGHTVDDLDTVKPAGK